MVLCSARKKLPYRQVIKTKAQEGVWNKAGRVAGTISEGKPKAAKGLGQVLWVSVGRKWPRGLEVVTIDKWSGPGRSCETVLQLPPVG